MNRMRRRIAGFAALTCLAAAGCGASSPAHPPAPTNGARSAPATSGQPTTGPGGPSTGSSTQKMVSEQNFLAGYVTTDGRVIRRDQGNDIVSEGQAYGMLVAEVAGKASLARTIWTWTKQHLIGKHGLIASRATGSGQVQDGNSAADADALLAYALLRYAGPGAASLHADGRRLAGAILAAETTTVGGKTVVLAGPWAKSPPRVDPSYWMPDVFLALAHYTGDDRWNQASDSALGLLEQVTSDGQKLPPDWAQIAGDGLKPIASPSGGAPVQYGLDAARLPIWLGTGCSDRARGLAAKWWQLLSQGDTSHYLAVSLTGQPINQSKHPLMLMAGAAAAAAAGDSSASESLRVQANDLAGEHPTYYGSAWLALGAALLDGRLDPCHDAGLR
jgi:endoglucanase